MKRQIPFLGKIRKIVKECPLLKKKIPRVLSVNVVGLSPAISHSDAASNQGQHC